MKGRWLLTGRQESHSRGESIQSAGVAPEVNLRNSTLARKPASEKSTLALKPRADVTKIQNRDISGPTKRTYVLQRFFKKKRLIQRIFLAEGSTLALKIGSDFRKV